MAGFPGRTYCIHSFDGRSMQQHIAALSNPEECYAKLSLRLDVRNPHDNWTPPNQALIVSFIATSTNLKSLLIDSCRWWGAAGGMLDIILPLVRKCVMAAKRNPQISRIALWTDLDNARVASVTEVLMIGREKVAGVHFEHKGALDLHEMELLNETVASLENLEEYEYKAFIPHDDLFLDLMTRLAQRRSTNLKVRRLCYRYYNDTKLPVIDLFLASPGASYQTEADISFGNSQGIAVQRMVLGLMQNTIIEKLGFRKRNSTPEVNDFLANYIRQSQPNLKKLEIGSYQDGTSFQEAILPALYDNTSLRKLVLGEGFYDASCNESVSRLLMLNSHLETLVIGGRFRPYIHSWISHSWIRSTADGLSHNSTLRKLVFGNYGRHSETPLDVRPLFDALLSKSSADPPSGLQCLAIYGCALAEGCVQTISSTMRNPACPLKDLLLWAELDDDEVLEVLSGAQTTSVLQSLELKCPCEDRQIDQDKWTDIASVLSKVNLRVLKVEMELEETLNSAVAHSMKEELLRGLGLNQILEDVVICLGPDFDTDSMFQSQLKEFCNRNMTVKASNALMRHPSSKTSLPLACLPKALDALQKRTGTTEEFSKLSNTLLFSVLRSRCQSSELWESIMSHLMGTE